MEMQGYTLTIYAGYPSHLKRGSLSACVPSQGCTLTPRPNFGDDKLLKLTSLNGNIFGRLAGWAYLPGQGQDPFHRSSGGMRSHNVALGAQLRMKPVKKVRVGIMKK